MPIGNPHRDARSVAEPETIMARAEISIISVSKLIFSFTLLERKELLNVYSAIAVNRTYNPEVNFEAAITFIKFLVSEKGQRIISQFGRDIYQQSLFYSAAQPLKQNADSQVAGWIREIAYFEGKECPERFQDDHKELYD